MCELEDSEKWRDSIAERKRLTIPRFGTMKKYFTVKSVEYSNVDISALKITLVAARKGIVPYGAFGITVKIKGANEECTNEVKRDGLIIERHSDIELRIGDYFVFYHSRSTPQLTK